MQQLDNFHNISSNPYTQEVDFELFEAKDALNFNEDMQRM